MVPNSYRTFLVLAAFSSAANSLLINHRNDHILKLGSSGVGYTLPANVIKLCVYFFHRWIANKHSLCECIATCHLVNVLCCGLHCTLIC